LSLHRLRITHRSREFRLIAVKNKEMELFDVLETTLGHFQTLYAEIGYSEEDQKRKVESFVASISTLCTNQIDDLQEEKIKLASEVKHSLEQIKRLAMQLDDGEVEMVRTEISTICPQLLTVRSY
jgi:hypothetical protein